MNGVVFDLDETLVDRRGSLDAYAKQLHSVFSDSIVVSERVFMTEFHRLDGNGRVPRDEFFEALSVALFRSVPSRRIQEHFEATAWIEPRLFEGVVRTAHDRRPAHDVSDAHVHRSFMNVRLAAIRNPIVDPNRTADKSGRAAGELAEGRGEITFVPG